MLFNSFEFLLVFLPIVLLFYYLPCFRKYQLIILILSGFVFYAYNHLEFLFLLIVSAVLNALFSYFTANQMNIKKQRTIAISGVVSNLCLLGFFKYGSLIYKSFFTMNDFGEWLILLPLPIGISFYTFQGISLLMDTYKNKEVITLMQEKQSFRNHLIRTVFFISFFPHSIAGPIVKAHTFLPQIKEKCLADIPLRYVFCILIQGYFFKTVVADNMQDYTFWISYPYFLEKSTLTLIIMMFGFSVQIFADFAGYSFIAIGIAKLFGYDLPANFNYPYISTSFSEFWKRWHISLSTWLKEYLYIPLGGNRKGSIRTYVNLFLVMLLGGMWHGAAWNYLFWGGVHGIALVVERFLNTKVRNDFYKGKYIELINIIKIMFVFTLVSWAWLFFKLPSFEHAIIYTKMIFSNSSKPMDIGIILYCLVYSMPIFLYHLFELKKNVTIIKKIAKKQIVIYAVMLALIILNGGNSDAFIYFQF